MKTNDPWLRLVAAARRAPSEALPDLPTGFSTRVAALGLAARREPADLLGAWALRALTLAVALVVVSALWRLPATLPADSAAADWEDFSAETLGEL